MTRMNCSQLNMICNSIYLLLLCRVEVHKLLVVLVDVGVCEALQLPLFGHQDKSGIHLSALSKCAL